MDENSRLYRVKQKLTAVFAPDQAELEELRLILQNHHNRHVDIAEAEEVGTELMSFIECLNTTDEVL